MENIPSIPEKHFLFGRELLERFLQIPYINNNAAIRREVDHALARLNDKSFKIAVVGEFSSGKSTFLNAIIGKDYLTHGVQETTATVTMLTNARPKEHEFGRVSFSDGTIRSLESYSQLSEVTTTHSSEYQVSRQIDSVELFTPFIDTEVPVVLVDTPGLNGVAAMHKERTIDIVQSVHACIYMLQSRGISDTDKKMLQWIGRYQRELIIVQNFIDDISKSEGDTLEDVLDKQRKILSDNVFSEQDQINYTVCGISAMKALAAKDLSIKRLYSTDTIDLTDADRQRLYEESNFEQTMNSINQFMQYASQRSHISTLYSINNLLERTANILNSQYDVIAAIWENSDDAQIVLRTQQLLDNWELRQAEDEKKLDNFIVSKMAECRRLEINELRRLIDEVEKNVPKILAAVSTPDEWDVFVKDKIMEMKIADCSNNIKCSIMELLVKFSENTYNLAILRIQEYSGLTDAFPEQSLPEFRTGINSHKLNRFLQEESDIKKEEAILLELQSQTKMSEAQKSRLLTEKQRKKEELIQKRQDQKRIQNEFNISKHRLGQMPEARPYYDYETDYEFRGGLGFLDAILGPKEVTRTVTRYDYSAQEQWKERERKLKNKLAHENSVLNSQLCSLEHETNSIQQQISELNKETSADMVRITKKKELILEKVESLQEKRTLAAKEYVQRQKDEMKNNVSDYLNKTLQPTLSEIINNEVAQTKDALCREIREIYIDVSDSQKENLKQLLNKNRSDDGLQHESLKQDMDNVLVIKNELEEYLCKQQTQTF